MDIDANRYELNTVKIRNNVKWIVKRDYASESNKWTVLNVVNEKAHDPSRYGLLACILGLGKRAYGINSTKWKVVMNKSKKSYHWKLIDKTCFDEKERLLAKLGAKFNDYMQMFGEPEEIDIDDPYIIPKILFYLKIYGLVFFKQEFSQEVKDAKIRILRELSKHLLNKENPLDDIKFYKLYVKLKKIYPAYDDISLSFACMSTFINTKHGFIKDGELKLKHIKDNKLCIKEIKNNISFLLNLNTNLVHRECLNLLSSCDIWQILTDVAIEYFSPIHNPKRIVNLPYIDSTNIAIKYQEVNAIKHISKTVEFTPSNLCLDNNNNDSINILITSQQNTALHLGFVMFSNNPEIKKLINKYLIVSQTRSHGTNYTDLQFNKILTKYWRALTNGMSLFSSSTYYFEAIPHDVDTNKKILLRYYLEKKDVNKFSFRFNMKLGNKLSSSMENLESEDKLKLCVMLKNGFEVCDLISDKKLVRKVVNSEKHRLDLLMQKLNKKKSDEMNSSTDYKEMVLTLPNDIKAMYGIYDFIY